MMTLIHKEFRLLRTAWIVALLLAVVPVWFQNVPHTATLVFQDPPWWLFPSGLGALLLGLAPFGQEFNFKTFNLLLVQPQPRRKLFLIKTATAGVAMLSVWLALYLSCQFRFAGVASSTQPLEGWLWVAALVAVVAFSGGLWTTLRFRQITASVVVAFMAPGLVLDAVFAVEAALFYFFHFNAHVVNFDTGKPNGRAIALIMLAYAAAGLWWARWQFLHAQDVPWTGGAVAAWSGRGVFLRNLFGRWGISGRRLRPTEALVRKELQLQHISVLLSLALACMCLTIMLVCPKVPMPFSNKASLLQHVLAGLMTACFGLLFVTPLFMGAAAVAEERRMGVMESFWHLPISRFRQFVTKLGVVLFLTILLAVVGPCVLGAIACGTGMFDPSLGVVIDWRATAVLSASVCSLAAISFYASTLSSNPLQAAALTLVLPGGMLLPLFILVNLPECRRLYSIVGIVECATCLVLLLSLSYDNYKRVQVDKAAVVLNAAVWLAAMVFIPAVALGTYFRSWELAMPLEPRHGPPQLKAGRAGLFFPGSGFFALLPDGRLWAAEDFSVQQTNQSSKGADWLVVPEKGTFIGGSNWMDVVQEAECLFGIKSDGTLWKISTAGLPADVSIRMSESPSRAGAGLHLTFGIQRIGTDSDWTMLSGRWDCCLALRRDGSLWGWGHVITGESAEQTTNGPVRIGSASDWVAVSAEGTSAMGVKRDGSVWEGTLVKGGIVTAPERCATAGTNWVVLDGGGGDRSLALQDHGAMWSFGGLAGPKLHWISPDTEWHRVENGRAFPEFKRRPRRIEIPLSKRLKYNRSQYSDWLTGDWRAGLAQDGTVSFWGSGDDVFFGWDVGGLLVPTRRPLWSINILNDK